MFVCCRVQTFIHFDWCWKIAHWLLTICVVHFLLNLCVCVYMSVTERTTKAFWIERRDVRNSMHESCVPLRFELVICANYKCGTHSIWCQLQLLFFSCSLFVACAFQIIFQSAIVCAIQFKRDIIYIYSCWSNCKANNIRNVFDPSHTYKYIYTNMKRIKKKCCCKMLNALA